MFTCWWSIAHATPIGPAPSQEVRWPDGDDAPRDAMILVVERQLGLADPPITRDDDGALVSVTSFVVPGTAGVTWRVMIPDEELAPGGYTVALADQLAAFTVVDQTAEIAGPPSPYRRWSAVGCQDGDWLSYRVCGGGVLHLAAVGDVEPAAVTLDDPGSAIGIGLGEDTLDLTGAFGVDAGGTVWMGSPDEGGRFTGWWDGDLVELPPDGLQRTEAPSGTTASSGTTATSVASCPLFSGWEVLAEEDCSLTEVVTTSAGCGCRSSGPVGGLWVVGLLLAAIRWPAAARSAAPRSR